MACTASPINATRSDTQNGRLSIIWIAHTVGFAVHCMFHVSSFRIERTSIEALKDGSTHLKQLLDLRLPPGELVDELLSSRVCDPFARIRRAFGLGLTHEPDEVDVLASRDRIGYNVLQVRPVSDLPDVGSADTYLTLT